MKYQFLNIQEVLNEIKNNFFNKQFAWELASSFIYEENKDIVFDVNNFNEFGFLFHFFLIEQSDLSDESFKELIEKVLSLKTESITAIDIKKILYEKQLNELEVKYKKKKISHEIYVNQVSKYLD